MSFPKTRDELKAAGYRFDNVASCRSCHADIEWWFTPNNSKMPFDFMQDGSSPAMSHFATCPDATAWRKRK